MKARTADCVRRTLSSSGVMDVLRIKLSSCLRRAVVQEVAALLYLGLLQIR